MIGESNMSEIIKDCTNCRHESSPDGYPGDRCFDCIRTESIDMYWESTKIIRVDSCKNCPNIRQGSKWEFCYLNGSQNKLSSDYSIPVWCPLDDEVEE